MESYITWSDLIQFGILIIAIIKLFNDNKRK